MQRRSADQGVSLAARIAMYLQTTIEGSFMLPCTDNISLANEAVIKDGEGDDDEGDDDMAVKLWRHSVLYTFELQLYTLYDVED